MDAITVTIPTVTDNRYRIEVRPSIVTVRTSKFEAPLIAREPRARHRLQICQVGSHRNRGETSAPRSAPSSVGQPPERRGQPPSECPTVASHHSPLEYRPVALAEESSSLTTVGSRACRGCPIGWPRTPQSTGHPRQPLPGWP